MQGKFEQTTSLSLRELEEQRLRKEANLIFSSAQPGFFFKKSSVELYIQNGLKKFDAQFGVQEDALIFKMDL